MTSLSLRSRDWKEEILACDLKLGYLVIISLEGDIPILGHLFKSKKFRDNKTQLVIFVTPTIYDAESDFNKRSINFEKEL